MATVGNQALIRSHQVEGIWTPLELSPLNWLNDEGVKRLSDGTVYGWLDSGTFNDSVAVPVSPGNNVFDPNSLGVNITNGSHFVFNKQSIVGSISRTIYLVYKTTSTSANLFGLGNEGNAVGGSFVVTQESGGIFIRAADARVSKASVTPLPTNQVNIISVVMDSSVSIQLNDIRIHCNFEEAAIADLGYALVDAAIDTIDNGDMTVGNSFSSITGLNGEFYELLVFDRVLSEEETLKLDGYLAHRWGLADRLPESHIYQTLPPYYVASTSFQPIDKVILFDWRNGKRVSQVIPDQGGNWTTNVTDGTEYGIIYIKENEQPLTHGPYSAGNVNFDDHYNQVELLLKFIGEQVIDYSKNAFTPNITNTPLYTSFDSLFDAPSFMILDATNGNNAYIDFNAYVNTLVIENTPWTIEAWVKRTGAGNGRRFMITNTRWGGYEGELIGLEPNGTFYVLASQGSGWHLSLSNTGSEMLLDEWYHIAVVFDQANSKLLLFKNGIIDHEESRDFTLYFSRPPFNFWINNDEHSGNTLANNFIMAEYRYTKGVARYTTEFTPPNATFHTEQTP